MPSWATMRGGIRGRWWKSKSREPFVGVLCDGLMGDKGVVGYFDGDKVTDISNCVTGVDIHMRPGDINEVTLHVLGGGIQVASEVEDVIFEIVPRSKIPDVIARLQKQLDEG